MPCHGVLPLVSKTDPIEITLGPTKTSSLDDCRISVEIAGPARAMTYNARPNDIRAAADQLINYCVFKNNGIGGFITKDFDNLINYVTAPQTDISGLFRKNFAAPPFS